MSQTKFTSRDEMERLFGHMGVALRLEGANDQEATLNFFAELASSQVQQYCGQFYSAADMETSEWVRHRCTWMACYLLSQRSGDASLFYGQYDQFLNDMQQVANGSLPIPGLATAEDMVPALSNIIHDPRYRYETLRVESRTSTGTPNSSKQFRSDSILPEWVW